ncbi:MAG TPA: TolC family protein [Terracidiphilus sp.]|nr:TolC family protein [Terracidiphilus sp.]
MKTQKLWLCVCFSLALACGKLLAQAPKPQKPMRITLAEAEQLAIQHNPDISVAHLLQLAQVQVTREVRSAELPTATADLTAVDAHDNTRITAGVLNNPSVYQRAAGGLQVDQLITDFGRTHRLVLSAKANAQAQLEAERATEQDITLAVDQAFEQALTARAVLKVAQETVDARQETVDEISALTQAKLKSTLDLSFAKVELSQAQLLLLDARSGMQSADAGLNALLGTEQNTRYDLVDSTPANPQVAPDDAEGMVQLAFRSRPDLASLNDNAEAAQQYSKAEHDLWHPTVSALAAVGGTPVRADQIASSWYGAAGANISIPVFNGFLFNARSHVADLQAHAAEERVRGMREVIARDVRDSVLNAQTAFQRIGVTQQMLTEANMALDLAETRYKIGLSGIVELSQAQLADTQAEIAYANARYSYQTMLAVVRYQTGQ